MLQIEYVTKLNYYKLKLLQTEYVTKLNGYKLKLLQIEVLQIVQAASLMYAKCNNLNC